MAPARRLILTLLKAVDLSVVTASFLGALAATHTFPYVHDWPHLLEMRISLVNVLFMVAYLGLWHAVLRTCGLYHSYRLAPASREFRDLGVAVLMATVPLVVLSAFSKFHDFTPSFLMTFFTIAFIALGLERRFLRNVGRQVRRYGRNLRNVIIVGAGDEVLDLASSLARREDLGYIVLDVIDPHASTNGNDGVLQAVQARIEQQPTDEVFVALPLDGSHAAVSRVIALCEEQGITVRLLAHVASLSWAQARVDEIHGQPVITLYTGRGDTPALLVKRAIDIVGATIGLILLGPLFLLVAAVIKLKDGGPVFFVQERVGLNRRRFPALKFRTMIEDAEELQSSLEPLNEAQGPVFKIENDPRVTRVGKWLRRLSIDELPQLFNVLRGEMSLVGPRPLPLRDVGRMEVRWHKRRFSVKPGITCLWQVNNRRPQFDEWIRADMEYIDNWSLRLDLKILLKTIPAVVTGQGAH